MCVYIYMYNDNNDDNNDDDDDDDNTKQMMIIIRMIVIQYAIFADAGILSRGGVGLSSSCPYGGK